MLALIEGKKTYIIAAVTIALGVADALGYKVPEAVYAILAALGLGTIRHGISKAS